MALTVHGNFAALKPIQVQFITNNYFVEAVFQQIGNERKIVSKILSDLSFYTLTI